MIENRGEKIAFHDSRFLIFDLRNSLQKYAPVRRMNKTQIGNRSVTSGAMSSGKELFDNVHRA